MIKQLLIVAIVLFVGTETSESQADDSNLLQLTFFEGMVEFLDGTVEYTRFRVVSNDAVIDVRNDTHLRFGDASNNPSRTFRILAPMTVVTIQKGVIPASCVKKYPISHYLTLKDQYEGKQPKSLDSHLLPPIQLADIKHFFSFSRKEWEEIIIPIATSMAPKEYEVRVSEYDTGTGIMAVRRDASMGYSLQPLYSDSGGRPDFFVLSTWFTKDAAMTGLTETELQRLGRMFQNDIGSTFSIELNKVDMGQYVGWRMLIAPTR